MPNVSVWRRPGIASAVCLWILALVSSVGAQVPREEPRLALVIGNSAYRESPLRNPVNDVRAMAQRLQGARLHRPRPRERHQDARWRRRSSSSGGGSPRAASAPSTTRATALQVRGRNYLVPVDAEIEDEASTRVAAVDVELLLEQMAEAKNRVNIVILDACRNNPFERRMRGASRGLAAVDAARGTLVAYATAPGSVAADGDGKNGLYTEELLEALREPGLKIEEVFKRVRINVARRSKGSQTPWESSSLTGDLVVNVTVNVTTAAVSAPTASVSAPATPEGEALFWMSIKDGTDPAAFEAYLKQYPQGTFAPFARQRLASVSQRARAPEIARFDGAWNVTVHCPAHGTASAYTRRLLAQVKDGALAAQQGDVGQPNSLTLSGKIQPDGKASIDARGMVGDPRNAVKGLSQGATYAYRVEAVFEGARGVGNRTDDVRPCSLTFVK